MGGKLKGKKKGKKGKKKIAIKFCKSPNEMSKKQLLPLIDSMIKEIDIEKEERNFFMLERQKLYALWNMGIEQLSIEREKSRLLKIELGQNQIDSGNMIDQNDIKLRFLLGEQSGKFGDVRLYQLRKMRVIQNDIWTMYSALRENYLNSKHRQRMSLLGLYNSIQSFKIGFNDDKLAINKDVLKEMKYLETSKDMRFLDEHESHEDGNALARTVAQRKKSSQVNRMSKVHEKLLLDSRTFFHDITSNNMENIRVLDASVEKLRDRGILLKKELANLWDAQDEMMRPLMVMEEILTKEVTEPTTTTMETEKKWKKVGVNLTELKHYERVILAANETLEQRIALVKEERDKLKMNILVGMAEARRKMNMQVIMNKNGNNDNRNCNS